MNHISHKVPGVEFSTGSLGHGLPFAVGKALAAKVQSEPWRVFVILSDGEMDEGSNWEALMFASHHKLTNLTIIIDYNKLQSLSSIENTLALEPLAEKLKAFGCSVVDIDGHDHNQIFTALVTRNSTKPVVIIANTIKGKGVSFMENAVVWHYKNPDDIIPMCGTSTPIKAKDPITNQDIIIDYDNSSCFACFVDKSCYSKTAIHAKSVFPIATSIIECFE
jgi:transketolase